MAQPTRIHSRDLTRRLSPALCLLVTATFACRAAPPRPAAVPGTADKVDAFIEAEMRKGGIPGLSLAVVQDGKVVKSKGHGLANIELNVVATPGTVYQLQSITKTFVACGIML